ncbi:hypothetical protein AXK11_03365 [Cephaloticoccus primus]|uniref:Glutamyl/glutaminyl-tRNA synthetase class Ib catalytic domain-containing protein n=1 Tax=Cephaloticoccus primus TaxID=1548207 RepID=A0A139SQM8_9BACT|nr:glutamate--tRNA ligase family protein [Cephaloticoccus primus]KXU36843.1 hypothetical protein AXK11_03365 [Cephaloticoccus primus]
MSADAQSRSGYRGRLAPSPTGYLHRGHAHTFSLAAQRARGVTAPFIGEPTLSARRGKLFLRIDDLDRKRCRPEFTRAAIEDLRWLGLDWEEPIVIQSQRLTLYRQALEQLHAAGLIYPCTRTRREIREYAQSRAARQGGKRDEHAGMPLPLAPVSPPELRSAIGSAADVQDHEPLFPAAFRPPAVAAAFTDLQRDADSPARVAVASAFPLPPRHEPIRCNWRFLTPDGASLSFRDSAQGEQHATVGRDFGDFLVWRKDDLPSYQLACVVDDIAMGITEVVRGADLLPSTFRQLLLYRALGASPPAFYHCDLVRDENGHRLAKRHASRPLRAH